MPMKVPEPNQYVLLEHAVTLLNGCPILVQSNPMMLTPGKTRSCLYCFVDLGSTEKLAYSFIVISPLKFRSFRTERYECKRRYKRILLKEKKEISPD